MYVLHLALKSTKTTTLLNDQPTVGDVVEAESVTLVDGVRHEPDVEISRRGREGGRYRPAAIPARRANQRRAGVLPVAHLSTPGSHNHPAND